ncbi:MAG TPA: alpha-glucosidase [Rectinemataceae bacterium]|nr:alpha-glucosidase [Rectinemataceae bacterium]
MRGRWWQEGVVYQIYPRSFRDSNGDGIGDLRGIVEKLDYIASLGVDIVWLNPIYASPNEDNGYDISDYDAIMDEFGTMADFQALLDGLHARGLRLVMDLVVNHSSDRHPWFVESRSSRTSPLRDFYIWKPGQAGGPPNNWKSVFGGPAWKLDPDSGEYYLHLFAPGQPDLNWENPELRQRVFAMMRRWFDRGIDGFRMDTINLISKDQSFRDLGADEAIISAGAPYINGPRVHEYIRAIRTEVLDRYDSMSVGECPGTTPTTALDYVGFDRRELDMLFQFELMELDYEGGDKWRHRRFALPDFKRCVERWQRALHGRGWNSVYLMNHDQPRSVSRFGDDGRWRVESARTLLMHLLSLGGTPYVYQGEEIGMTNVAFPSIGDYRDIEILNHFAEWSSSGRSIEEIMASIHRMGRDNARTPMQWDSTAHAGFSAARPWIAVNQNYASINVAAAEADRNSILAFFRAMTAFRRAHPSLVYGGFELLGAEDRECFAYRREDGSEALLVALNFSPKSIERDFGRGLVPLLSTYPPSGSQGWPAPTAGTAEGGSIPGSASVSRAAASEAAGVELRPWEGIVFAAG